MSIYMKLPIFIFIVILSGCMEMPDMISSNKYANYNDAKIAGDIDRGWIPSELPQAAVEISEVHDIDSNSIWITFRYNEKSDIKQLIEHCTLNQNISFPEVRIVKRDVPWWPSDLTSKGSKKQRLKWKLYVCPRVQHGQIFVVGNLAIDETTRKVWYWTKLSNKE